jgi:hypothetical protein
MLKGKPTVAISFNRTITASDFSITIGVYAVSGKNGMYIS